MARQKSKPQGRKNRQLGLINGPVEKSKTPPLARSEARGNHGYTHDIIGSLRVTVMQQKFYGSVQNFIVNGYGVAVVRNMAPKGKNKGYLANIRRFLKKIDLADVGRKDASQFPQMLDDQTEKLRRHMPRGARHWGTAASV